MITEQRIREIVKRHLEGTTQFLVDVSVQPGRLVVEIDDRDAITISSLAQLNRAVREELGADADDHEMQFSSPGAGRPFKVEEQYHKHVGRTVDVQLTDGRNLTGILASYGADTLGLQIEHPSKIKGRPATVDAEITHLPLADVQHTRSTIKFN